MENSYQFWIVEVMLLFQNGKSQLNLGCIHIASLPIKVHKKHCTEVPALTFVQTSIEAT